MEEMEDGSVPLVMLSRKSSHKKMNEDLFGSICMSFWDSGSFVVPQGIHGSKRRSPDMMDTIID